MGNPLPKNLEIGTIGELLVQLRLLQFGVQAAPPLKDSGNDLVAIKGDICKYVQVKTSVKGRIKEPDFKKKWHIYAFVSLVSQDSELCLDRSSVKILPRPESNTLPQDWKSTHLEELSAEAVNRLWGSVSV